MQLCVCPVCGIWRDVSLAEFITTTWNNAMKYTPEAKVPPQSYPCPDGHGPMVQVQPDDRLFLRDQTVDAEESSKPASVSMSGTLTPTPYGRIWMKRILAEAQEDQTDRDALWGPRADE